MLRLSRSLSLIVALAATTGACSDNNPSAPATDGAVAKDVGLADASRADASSSDAAIDDGGSTADGGSPTGCALPPGGTTHGAHVLRFEHATSDLQLVIARKHAGTGVGESSLYDLDKMIIRRQGVCVVVDQPAALSYDNSHHNWLDIAYGTAGPLRYELELTYQPGAAAWKITARAVSLADQTIAWGPEALIGTGGPIDNWFGPAWLPIRIEEFMAHNTSTYKDEAGEHDPWIEIFNPSSSAIDLSGYFLSDDPDDRKRWTFPAGTTVGRHEFLLVVADGQPAQGPLHTSFKLAATGGALILSAPDGTSSGERTYGAQTADVSLGLAPSGGYEPTATATPGAANPGD